MSSQPWVFVKNRSEVSNVSKCWFVNKQGSWSQTFLDQREPSFPRQVSISVLFWSVLVPEAEKAMAPHSNTLAWKIPWTEEPGRLHSTGSLRVRHN